MTAIQLAFALALTLVLLAVLGFGVVIGVGAARSGSGAYLDARFLGRFSRSPAERAEADRWAFYAHRFTGFAIFAFLALHVVDVSLYAVSQRLYTQEHRLYGSWPLRLFECGLLVMILFHTFNGLRLLLTDLANLDLRLSRGLLAGAVALTLVLGLAGSVVILKPVPVSATSVKMWVRLKWPRTSTLRSRPVRRTMTQTPRRRRLAASGRDSTS